MSYNIDNWKTKKIEGLKIPLSEIEKLPYVNICFGLGPVAKDGTMPIEITGPSEGFELNGILLDNEIIAVIDIENYGEGSGSTWDDFKEMLSHSEGELEAVMIWESGDSLSRLIVKNGIVTDEPVEL